MTPTVNSNHLLEYVNYLEAIKMAGSFAAAARRLSVSQPALSQAVARIESQVKFSIFHRSFSGAVLTFEGQRLLDELNRCKIKIAETCASLRMQSTHQQNVLKIVTKPLLLTTLLPKLIPLISSIEPDHQIKLIVNFYNNEIDEMISNGSADMAFIPLIHSGRTGYKRFTDHKLFAETFNFWSQPEQSQVSNQVYILNQGLFSEKTTFESFVKMLTKGQFQVQALPDYASVASMAAFGQGMSLLPMSFAAQTNLKPYVGTNQMLHSLISKMGFPIGFRSFDDGRASSQKRIKLIKKICARVHENQR